MYICDLAEWGVVIDSPAVTEDFKAQYWDPMWKTSYTRDDCDVQAVMDGLKIDRTPVNQLEMTKIQYEEAKIKLKAQAHNVIPTASARFYATKKDGDDYDSDADKDDLSDAEEVEEC